MSRVELLDAGSEGTVTYKFKVRLKYANANNVVHGGAYGVLFGTLPTKPSLPGERLLTFPDMFTTTALGPISRPGYWEFQGGVTRNLNISYLRGIPLNSTVLFRSRVIQHGKTAALIYGEALSEDGKKVYATAEHHKINVPMPPEHKAIRVKWDDVMDQKMKKASTPQGKL
ncbi:MAG: hypothetical protein Q9162_001355 [Coniocarpon cinnabarinum]